MIKGQQIYLGPRLHAYSIGYGFVFYNGVHPALELAIKNCPAIAELVVPIAQAGAVRRELNFDYAHNMRGQSGKFATLYRTVQAWLGTQKQAAPAIDVKHKTTRRK